jgi:hypothetical protein
MVLPMDILSVSIMTGLSGPDLIFFKIDKPGSMFPYTEPFTLKGECANRKGLDYIKTNFFEIDRVKYIYVS